MEKTMTKEEFLKFIESATAEDYEFRVHTTNSGYILVGIDKKVAA